MFTPIEELPVDEQARVIESLDATVEWEATWDIGLTDPDDAFSATPRWGRYEVAGRWPVAFPLGHRHDPRPWRTDWQVPGGHRRPGNPSAMAIPLETIGAGRARRARAS